MTVSMLQGGFSPALATGGGGPSPDRIAKIYDILGPWDLSNPEIVEGDFGVFTPDPSTAGAPTQVIMRFSEGVPWENFNVGSTPMWLPVDVYENNPRIRGFVTGSEPNTSQFLNQNIAFASANGGSVSLTGGYCQLNAPAQLGSFARLVTSSFTGEENFYITAEIMVDITQNLAGNATAVFTQPGPPSLQANTQYSFGTRSGFGLQLQNWYWDNTTSAYVAVTQSDPTIRRSSLSIIEWPTIAGDMPCFFQAISGKDIDDIVTTRIDGATQSTWRRAADGATTATNLTLNIEATGSLTAPQSGAADIRIRNFYWIVFD